MAIQSKTVISSMFWKLLERFSSQLVSFVISIILARILLPSDYGIIAIILVFINLADVIIDGGLNTALIQKKDANQKDFSTIFWFSLLVATVLYTILFFCAPLIASFYNNDLLIPVLRVLSISIFFYSFNSIQRAYVSRHMLFRRLFYVNAVALLASGINGIIMAYQGWGVWALVYQTLSNSIICCILLFFTVRWRPTMEFSVDSFKALFNYGWKIFMTNIIISFYQNVRSLIIGKLYQPSVLAFFDRGKMFPSLLMSNITASIDSVLLPTFSNEQDNIGHIKQMMSRSVKMSYFFVSPLLVGFFIVAEDVVLILLTEKWLPAVPFIRIFCIAFLLMPIQNINMVCTKSLGYSGITLKLEIIKKVIEAIILVLSFAINVYAVAWGIVVYNFICIFINVRPSKKLLSYGIKEQFLDIMPVVVASLAMGFVVFLCGQFVLPAILLLIIKIFIGLIVYFLICNIFKLEAYTYFTNYIKMQFKNDRNR